MRNATVFKTFSWFYHQINLVKEQQHDIIAQLHAEYLDAEEQMMGLGLEVRLISAVSRSHSFCSSLIGHITFHSVEQLSVS